MRAGLWPLHCHIMTHHIMGQQLYMVEAPEKLTKPPKNLLKCPKKCIYNFAPFDNNFVQSTWGNGGFELPLVPARTGAGTK